MPKIPFGGRYVGDADRGRIRPLHVHPHEPPSEDVAPADETPLRRRARLRLAADARASLLREEQARLEDDLARLRRKALS